MGYVKKGTRIITEMPLKCLPIAARKVAVHSIVAWTEPHGNGMTLRRVFRASSFTSGSSRGHPVGARIVLFHL